MKKIELSWILFLLLIMASFLYYKEDIIDIINDKISINEVIDNKNIDNYNKESIVSYSNNSKIIEDNKDYITGSEYSFDSEYYVYYSYLSLEGKKIYKQVYANALVYNKTFKTVTKISTNELSDVMEALFNDHPELFYLDTNYSYKYNSKAMVIEITLNYNDTVYNINYNKELFNKEIDKIVLEAEKLPNNYEKEKYVYMYLINKVEYDTNAKYNQSAYSALVEGKSVCAGYARAFQLVMQRLNIPTYYVLGYAKEDHAWNIVKLDGIYYNVDLTWDDTGGVFKHFNITDEELSSTHKRNGISTRLPRCVYKNYNMG